MNINPVKLWAKKTAIKVTINVNKILSFFLVKVWTKNKK
ncbi:hypothetical protein TRIP_D120003 [uncultured Paludibacter sp.]|nr:hypothetical protein TRIP_D120003 [uncultured Paludibacter sp.]